mmetsp:Transcript_45975/g.77289  ORF Transcript_45975/g.77289 Transcript_45975/m.77289 type:complete len:89 (+) Transcript_45975:542-808(+)
MCCLDQGVVCALQCAWSTYNEQPGTINATCSGKVRMHNKSTVLEKPQIWVILQLDPEQHRKRNLSLLKANALPKSMQQKLTETMLTKC